jgi:dTDP-4-dehydrorhamnose 3,5-epimerase
VKAHPTPLAGVLRIVPELYRDARGFFMETYHAKKFAQIGIDRTFVQDNQSLSAKGVLRGLHFQKTHPQAKLVRVVSGSAFDAVVDLRPGSGSFGRWYGLVLTAASPEFLYVPEGFAHGFMALEDQTNLLYKCTDFYDPADEGGLLWNDPDVGIAWPDLSPILSLKDASFPGLREIVGTGSGLFPNLIR